MIDGELRARIRRLFYAEHWKVGTIATQLGIHRDTVMLAIEAQRFQSRAGMVYPSQLDPYKAFIVDQLEQYPRLRATRLFAMVRARGYAGSEVVVRRYVRTVRPVPKSEAYLHLTTLPGEQGQVDWASFGKVRIGAAHRALSCFVMVLSHSRAMYARFALDQTLESFVRGHVEAFRALGGVPRVLLYEYVSRNIFRVLFPDGICAVGRRSLRNRTCVDDVGHISITENRARRAARRHLARQVFGGTPPKVRSSARTLAAPPPSSAC